MPIYEGIGLISEKQPVVIEIGHSYTKVGFAGETCPKCAVATDQLIPAGCASNESESSTFVSKYLSSCQEEDESHIYELLVKFFHQVYFRHLLVTPKERKVIIVESIMANSRWRKLLAKVLFLHYEILSILFVPSHLAVVSALGIDAALVLDVGSEEATVVPVVSGITMLSLMQGQDLGSNRFDERLTELLEEHSLSTKFTVDELKDILSDKEFIEDIRIRSCFVIGKNKIDCLDQLDMKPLKYFTKSGQTIEFNGLVRGMAAEIWFQTNDLDGISLPQMILDTLAKCPIDTRRQLASSIVIAGGTAELPGFKERLIREIKSLSLTSQYDSSRKFTQDYEFRFHRPLTGANCLAWVGGSLYGSLENVALRGVSKEYFLKYGHVPDWADALNSHLPIPLHQQA